MAAAKPAQLIPAEGVARTNTRQKDVTGSTGITGSGDGALGYDGGGEPVKAEDEDAFIASRCTGAERDVSTTSSQGRRHSRASCAFALEDQRKIASMEEKRREAVAEVCRKHLLIDG